MDRLDHEEISQGRTVRRAVVGEAGAALEIVQEAARWSSRFGEPIWDPQSFSQAQYRLLAEAGELVVGHEGGRVRACMWLQASDPVVWPDDRFGEAVYVHKLAVSRSDARTGWPKRLLEYALASGKRAGADAVRLDTIPHPTMISMYQDLGWRLVDRDPGVFGGRLLVRLERRLEP